MSTVLLDPPRGSATRRQVLGGAGLLFLTAACGGDGSAGSGSGDGGFPATIEHKHGTAEVPAPPRRIVTVGLTEQDYVLALGVAPVGVREWFGGHPGALWPWARRKLGDQPVPEVLPNQELEFEQIAALKPDAILGLNSDLTKDEYDKLSRIAPTVAQPSKYADFGVPWQELTRVIGRALGRSRQAERLIPGIEQRFARARDEHPEFEGATGLLATSIDGKPYAYAEGPAPGFLTALGVRLPSETAALFSGDNRAPVEVSLERLNVLEADVLVLGEYGDQSSSIATKDVYKALDVAQQGRDVRLPEMSRLNGALSFGSVLSLPVALNEVVPRLATAIDGDPATEVESVS